MRSVDLKLSPKDQEWLDQHEMELPSLERGERIGRRRITYFEELIPERLSALRTGYDNEDDIPIGSYAVSQTLLGIAVQKANLSAMEIYVLSRVSAGLKQREIAHEVNFSQPHITRIIKSSLLKLRKSIYAKIQ
jgi:DNA-binding NarL/FixJ family response regulator